MKASYSKLSGLLAAIGGCFVISMAASTPASSGEWGYSGEHGPAHWGDISPKFSACKSGVNQSPINLDKFVEANLAPIAFHYGGQATEILNNGHTVQANYAPGSTIVANGKTFELKQFHFHNPSENHIKGKSFPMEAHFVHAAKDGSLAVVAVMLEEGAENAALKKLWAQMPQHAGVKNAMKAKVAATELLPKSRDYYRFNGSLTTPPCSEGVLWMVMKTPVSLSAAQVEAFHHVMHHANNRPIQATNARPVLQ